jgi:hypothetical protein
MRNDINALRADPRRCACASAKQSHRTAHAISCASARRFGPVHFGGAKPPPQKCPRGSDDPLPPFLAKRQNETPLFPYAN